MPAFRLPVRQLVEFLLRTGSIDSRFTGFDRANEGARIHRKLQKAAGEGYAAEVFLSGEREAAGIPFTIEGRADGIFTDEAGVTVIDEIKTTAVPTDDIAEDMNPCHWAQGMVYGALYGRQQGLEKLDVRLTYYQIDTDDILRFVRHFTLEELEAFLQDARAVRPLGAASAGVEGAAGREPFGAGFPLPGLPARAEGAGRRSLPRLHCRAV